MSYFNDVIHLASIKDTKKRLDETVTPACGSTGRKGDRFIIADVHEVTCKRCLKRMDKGQMIFED